MQVTLRRLHDMGIAALHSAKATLCLLASTKQASLCRMLKDSLDGLPDLQPCQQPLPRYGQAKPDPSVCLASSFDWCEVMQVSYRSAPRAV